MLPQTEFLRLFEPGYIGKMEVKNRVVFPAIATGFATENGEITDLLIDHYEQRAKGGVGLIVTEMMCVDSPQGKAILTEACIDDDRYLHDLKRLTSAVHRHGAKIAVQLHHAGRESDSMSPGHPQPMGPSPIAAPAHDKPREITKAEIKGVTNCFAEAAARAKNAGFDAVEIHAASGYLLAEFISSAMNKRQDEYGGDLRNRTRFLLEVIRAIREAVGDDYPVWSRLNGREAGLEDGVTIEEAQQVAKMAEEETCDAISVGAFGYGRRDCIYHLPEKPGTLVPLAEAMKHIVNVPVIAVGAITPELGETILEKGKADFVAVGRGLLSDPEFVTKIAQGRPEDIVPCIHCLECMISVAFKHKGMVCSVNASLGCNPQYRIMRPVTKPKNVIVLGGGPAGLEVGRVAALRGHKVTICEKEAELGGQLRLAKLPPYKGRIGDYLNYLCAQIQKLKVEGKIRTKATPELVQDLKADSVVVATGPERVVPDIPGLFSTNSVFAEEALSADSEVGKNAVILGGGLVGCETAEFLAGKGKKVTIVSESPRLAKEMVPLLRAPLLSRLRDKGVDMFANVTIEEVSESGVQVISEEGDRRTIAADTVVIAKGYKPNRELYDAIKGKVPEIHIAGDSKEPRTILAAVSEGFNIGIAL
jgi:2,4-dienoyl-CoA reductase-like NADH-dependent reductase (Old Yellow Enzyme family)/thioredoxin reductase